MLAMDRINDIRFRYYRKGENISQIAGALQLDRKTVRKYIDKTDFNMTPPKAASEKRLCPKLDPFKPIIDKWLIEDKDAPRKQRHTALRVFRRLEKECEGFDCSYRTVAKYYSVRHKEIFSQNREGFLPLEHSPGEIQVDFGAADFYENGKRHSGKYLEVTFPYSNKGYLQLNYGENMECLLEGLDAIFTHIGAVPHQAWFDNTKTIVTKVIKGGDRLITERFERFEGHYLFQAIYTNLNSGHEKGCVENKVGYHRRNLLVPIPRFNTLADYNKELLQMCEDDALRDHYRHNKTIEELFAEDLMSCHPLPKVKLNLAGLRTVTTNKWGKFYLNGGLHEYSVSPKHASTVVNLELTSSHITVLDENFREIVRHSRLYGGSKQQSMDWLPYLKQISLRPRALKHTGIYDMMPPDLKQFLEGCSNTEIGKVLKVLAELTDRSGFDSALNTVSQALCYGAADSDSLINLYRRIYANVPELPPMPLGSNVPELEQIAATLDDYDAFLKGGAIDD